MVTVISCCKTQWSKPFREVVGETNGGVRYLRVKQAGIEWVGLQYPTEKDEKKYQRKRWKFTKSAVKRTRQLVLTRSAVSFVYVSSSNLKRSRIPKWRTAKELYVTHKNLCVSVGLTQTGLTRNEILSSRKLNSPVICTGQNRSLLRSRTFMVKQEFRKELSLEQLFHLHVYLACSFYWRFSVVYLSD